MERIMTMDEEDIIRLIAKSVNVDVSKVKLKLSTESSLYESDDESFKGGLIDTNMKFYARIELPITQIDGTIVEDGELFYAEDEDDDDLDKDS